MKRFIFMFLAFIGFSISYAATGVTETKDKSCFSKTEDTFKISAVETVKEIQVVEVFQIKPIVLERQTHLTIILQTFQPTNYFNPANVQNSYPDKFITYQSPDIKYNFRNYCRNNC